MQKQLLKSFAARALVRPCFQHPSACAHADALHRQRQRARRARGVAVRVPVHVAPRVARREAHAEDRPGCTAGEAPARVRLALHLRAADRRLRSRRAGATSVTAAHISSVLRKQSLFSQIHLVARLFIRSRRRFADAALKAHHREEALVQPVRDRRQGGRKRRRHLAELDRRRPDRVVVAHLGTNETCCVSGRQDVFERYLLFIHICKARRSGGRAVAAGSENEGMLHGGSAPRRRRARRRGQYPDIRCRSSAASGGVGRETKWAADKSSRAGV